MRKKWHFLTLLFTLLFVFLKRRKRMGRSASASSSIDSNTYSPSSSASLCLMQTNIEDSSRADLSTDLRLGLTISPPHTDFSSTSTTTTLHREKSQDWPPIKQLLRSSLAAAGKANSRRRHQQSSLFVKVYMEGIPIGRKLDLFALDSYNALINTLSLMFTTTIICPETERSHSNKYHIVTYEDQDGDWMMVGDVPWEMFVTSVKRLKITRADRC